MLHQTYANFEFLILDDASTDQTAITIKKIKDARIQLIEKPVNTGYTNSLNYGLSIAKGKYIARMDGDDFSLPERLQQQVDFLEAHPEVVLCGTSYRIMGNSKNIGIPEENEAIKLGLLKGNCIAHPSVMFRASVFKTHHIRYDSSREPAEDYALWVRLLSFGKLHNLPEVLLQYRLHSGQVSRKRAEEQRNSAIKTKFDLLQFSKVKLDTNDRVLLTKIFTENTSIVFNELKGFKQLQQKLLKANAIEGFFESVGFKGYLIEMEAIVLKKCFNRQERHSPIMYVEYLLSKLKWNVGFSMEQELKLGIKSLLFRRVTKM
jgi:glycosyltransferase involved in cell wall biosynthesis